MENINNNDEFVDLIISANDAKMGQKFGPIIGQHGINIKLFCDNFNNLTKFLFKGIPIRIRIIIQSNTNFDILILGFNRKFFLDFFFKNNNKQILLKDIYKIILLEQKLKKINFNEDLIKSEIKTIINYLKKNKYKIVI